MQSDAQLTIHPQAGVYRLQTAGLADPVAGARGRSDVLVRVGDADDAQRRWGTRVGPIEVIAVGSREEIDAHEASVSASSVPLQDSVLLPGLVNAHTHLDLSHLGPIPHDPEAGFVAWVDRVRAGRAYDPDEIAASVRRGIELSLAGGTVLVGDIAGAPSGSPSLVPFETLAASPLAGVSFLEFFAIGSREAAALQALQDLMSKLEPPGADATVRLGLQPHAPNTVSLDAYRVAVELTRGRGLPLSTHLAETPEERAFVSDAAGPQRELLERLGAWDDSILETCGRGASPIEHVGGVLTGSGAIVAHVNDLGGDDERGLERLAASGVHVAYCPRASEYFGVAQHFGPHRYCDMLDAGVNVCLGTDSILNLPADTAAPRGPGMSTLEEARLLFRRDGTKADTLLRMMTSNGARALGRSEAGWSMQAGARPLAMLSVDVSGTDPALDPASRVMLSASPARFLLKSK